VGGVEDDLIGTEIAQQQNAQHRGKKVEAIGVVTGMRLAPARQDRFVDTK
jgi:hypothetical protein